MITRRAAAWIMGLAFLGMSAPGVFALPSTRSSSKESEAQASFKEGLEHQNAKRYEEAIEAYDESLRHDRDQAEALSNLGFCYKELGRYQKAVGYYRDAIRLKPDLAEAHEYLGEAYLQMGKRDLAEQEYQALLKLDPEEAEELKRKIETGAPSE